MRHECLWIITKLMRAHLTIDWVIEYQLRYFRRRDVWLDMRIAGELRNNFGRDAEKAQLFRYFFLERLVAGLA